MSPLRGRLTTVGLSLAAGAAAALAHPPFGLLPGLLGYPLLLWLVDRSEGPRPLRSAFWRGWLAGFAYFGIGCWWVAEAFLVDQRQAWMAPFAASLLPAGLALFWGAACAVWRRIRPDGLSRALVFAAVFSLFEWLRGHVLTGLPWNLPGETWRAGGAMSQFASVVGAYGLTAITLGALACLTPLAWAGARRTRAIWAGAGMGVLAVVAVFGLFRLSGAEVKPTATIVRIIQPDVPQEDKWDQASFRAIVERYVALTSAPSAAGAAPDIVVWPEGALPAAANELFAPGAWTRDAIAGALKPGQVLMIGTYRGEQGPDGRARYFNSLAALRRDADGLTPIAIYDKHRLVPFGEFLPLEPLAEAIGLKELVHVGDGFSSGPRPAPMSMPGLPLVQPLICYEGLFPGLPDGRRRAAWFVNVSNDAWFGRTSGPRQHLNLASYRAIEQGLPMVRSTPTGVSALVDPWGRIRADHRLEPGERGHIDAPLPEPLKNTYFSQVGDLAFWLLVAAGLALSGPARRLLTRGSRPAD